MKTLSLIAIFISILFFSCSKSTEETQDTDYYLRFEKNGTMVNYTGYVLAHRDTVNGFVELTILGANSIPLAATEHLGIYLNNFPGNANITTGQYQDNSTNHTLLTTHLFGNTSFEAGQSLAESSEQENIPLAKLFKLIITEINETSIRGTFEGDYYESADVTTGNMIQIREGSFYVLFQ